MNTTILDLASQYLQQPGAESMLTFRPFINYLKNLKDTSSGNRKRFLSFVIEKYEQHAELLGTVQVEEIKDHAELLEMIYSILSPLIEDEEKLLWALSLPLRPVIFYSTNAYFNLVHHIASGVIHKKVTSMNAVDMKNNHLKFSYSLILEKCYNISSFFKQETVHSFRDEETGLVRYFKMNIDTRFIDIHMTGPLPELKVETLQSVGHDHDELIPCSKK
ncbi:MAG: hypothetical protein ABIN89_13900 [Chitinophagaceae bacterium]